VSYFTGGEKQIVGNRMKIAVQEGQDQAQVWAGVAQHQAAFSANVGADVRDADYSSSFLLTLENPALEKAVDEYTAKLKALAEQHPDAIGFVSCVNGKLTSADVYAAHGLFVKLWPKLLDAAAAEAIAAGKPDGRIEPPTLAVAAEFLQQAQNAPPRARKVNDRVNYVQRESDAAVRFEAMDEASRAPVHENVLRREK